MSLGNFSTRHIGASDADVAHMLNTLGVDSLDTLLQDIVPSSILDTETLKVPSALSEEEALHALQQMASKNKVVRSLLGQGYFDLTSLKLRRGA